MGLIEFLKKFLFEEYPHTRIGYALFYFILALFISPIIYILIIPIIKHLLFPKDDKKTGKSIYEDHFREVEKRRKEELEKLRHYVPLELEIKLAQRGGSGKEKAESVLLKCLNEGENAIIIGDSGAGKTFTFLKLFEELKKEFSDGNSSFIPLFIEMYKFKPVEHINLPAFIQKYIGIDENRFREDKGKYILFLDGLNESPDPNTAFGEISAVWGDMRIFVSTQREEPFFPRDAIYYMLTLGEEEVIRYLSYCSKLGNETSARNFYNQLNKVIQDQIKRPVFLFFLALLYEETGEIPNDLDALLSRFVNFVCKRTFEGGGIQIGIPLAPFYKEDVLPYIAYSMCKENKRGLSESELRRWFLEVKNDPDQYYDFRTQVCKRYWLMRHSAVDESFEFTHELLRDYFAAVYIRRSLPQ